MARHASALGALFVVLSLVRAQSVHLRARRHHASDDVAASEHLGEAPTLFFFVGLEGAGGTVLREVWLDSFNDFTVTRSDELTGTVSDDYAHHVLHLPSAWECKEDWEPADHDELVAKMRELRKDEVWSLPFQATWPSCEGGGGVSGHSERRFHPNLEWVQYAARAAGVDLHVVFLHKELGDCLALTCTRRGYGAEACQNQSRSLQADARELAAQVRTAAATDHGAVSCFRYPSEREVQREVLRDILVYNVTHIRGIFAGRDAGEHAAPVQGVDVSGLQVEATMLDALCGDMAQLGTKGLSAIFEKSRQLDAGSSTGSSGTDPAAEGQPSPEPRSGGEEIGGDGPQQARLPPTGELGTLQGADEGDHLQQGELQPAGEGAQLRQGEPQPGGGKDQQEQGRPQPAGEDGQLQQGAPQPADTTHTLQQGGGGAMRQPTNEEEEERWEFEHGEFEHGSGEPEPQPASGEEGEQGSGSKQIRQPRNEEEEQEWEDEREAALARSAGPPGGGRQAKEWKVRDDQWPWEEAGGGTEAGRAQASSETLPRIEGKAKEWTVKDDQWPWEGDDGTEVRRMQLRSRYPAETRKMAMRI